MALQQSDLDRLERALATGTLSVDVDGKRITYRTIDDLLKAIDYVRGQLSSTSSATLATSFVSHSRG